MMVIMLMVTMVVMLLFVALMAVAPQMPSKGHQRKGRVCNRLLTIHEK
jgi:hypothetical protein